MSQTRHLNAYAETPTAESLEQWFFQALALHQNGQLPAAQALYKKVLAIQPEHFDALHYLGISAAQSQQFQQAIELLNRAVKVNPDSAQAYNNLGLAQYDARHYDAALLSFKNALNLRPDYAEAHANAGNTFKALQQYNAALDYYHNALKFNPELADTLLNCGLILYELKRYQSALNHFRRVLTLTPDRAEAYLYCGNTQASLNRYPDALNSYQHAIKLNPQYAEAHLNLGNVLKVLKRADLAEQHYETAIAIRPDFAEAYNNYGLLLQERQRPAAAQAYYERAIALKPGFADSHLNCGLLLADLHQPDAALKYFNQAQTLNPNLAFVGGYRLAAKDQLCDWQNREQETAELTARIRHGIQAISPLILLGISDNPLLQKLAAEIWSSEKYPATPETVTFTANIAHNKIRLGYFSADFGPHPVAFLIAELFAAHNRSRFEIYAFSIGPDSQHPIRARLKTGVDHFIDLQHLSDPAAVQLIRNLEIDIAIDLGGHTQGSRTGLFAQRLAPVQVNYLGYPGTMGAEYMDYLLADRTVIPAANHWQYAEKIASLPHCYLVNAANRPQAKPLFSRAELGLPEKGIVFCCFNNTAKITPDIFNCWLRILSQVTDSVLWLFADNPSAISNLKNAAQQGSIAAERLIFAPRLPDFKQHLARYLQADLFLDTLPYNAHATASDALWAGVPVLTCPGQSFASRVAASQLQAIGLPELISANLAGYEALAIELAVNPQKLANIKHKLQQNRLTHPLFNIQLYRQHIEAAYTAMYDRYRQNLPADNITIQEE